MRGLPRTVPLSQSFESAASSGLTDARPETVQSGAAIQRWIGPSLALLIVVAMAFNPIEVKTSAEFDRATQSLGFLTLSKLGISGFAAVAAALGLLLDARTRRLLMSVPGSLLVFLGVIFVLTSVFANKEFATISRASAILYLVYLALTATGLSVLGCRKMILAIVAGAVCYLLLTWFLFILVPEKGRFQEYVSATETVTRMGGTGHPNNIAKMAITVGLMSTSLIFGRRDPPLGVGVGHWLQRGLLVLAILLAAITLVATFSRTATLAGLVALVVMFRDRLYGRGGIVLAVVGSAVVTCLMIVITLANGNSPVAQKAVGVITKSGDVEELTSLTGRTAIWEEALGFISQRPITGWGMDSAASIMSKRATGTHNLLLHVGFSAGVLAAIVILIVLVWSLIFGITSNYEWIRAVLVYVLISGLVEDTIIESFAYSLTMLWMMALLAPTLTALAPQPSTVGAPAAAG